MTLFMRKVNSKIIDRFFLLKTRKFNQEKVNTTMKNFGSGLKNLPKVIHIVKILISKVSLKRKDFDIFFDQDGLSSL